MPFDIFGGGGFVPAPIRYNNPGGMYPGPSASAFGSTDYGIIGGGHKIARFDDPVSGAAAQFDLLRRGYSGLPLDAAITKWSGGNSSPSYVQSVSGALGVAPNTRMSDVLGNPSSAVSLAKAMSKYETGRDFPLSDEQWTDAYNRSLQGGAPGDYAGGGATSSSKARNMPTNSLMDLLSGEARPADAMGQPTDWGNALAARSNSLIGLGMGLMQPVYPGQSPLAGGLKGLMAGAQADESAAQNAWRRNLAERQFGLEQQKFNITDAQKAMRDVLGPSASAEDKNKFMRDFYFSKTEGDWKPGVITDPNTETQHPYAWNQRSNEYRWGPNGPPPSLGAPPPPAAAAPDPFTRGTGGVGYGAGGVGNRGFGTGFEEPGTMQPGMPPLPQPAPTQAPLPGAPVAGVPPALANAPPSVRKDYQKKVAERMASGPSAHEQASIEKADDAVSTNQNAINALQYAKRISPNAPSGILAPASDYLGQAVPSLMSEQTKNRLLLTNAVASNAVEQLRATFGGNPTEGERKILIELQGSVNQPDTIRQEIFDRAIELANKRLETNRQRAQGIRGGTYYQPGGGGGGGGGAVRTYDPATGKIN
jgi:hypothetical protein